MVQTLALVLTVLLAEGCIFATPLGKRIAGVQATFADTGQSRHDQAKSAQPNYDARAERELLELVNRARAQSRVAPLQVETCLTLAARQHGATMASHRQISHQFPGEPAFTQRIAANCTLHLDETAENVGVADDAHDAHQGFVHSPPHRANLMNPSYNVVGIGIVRSASRLYAVQDFGHSLPDYSPQEAAKLVALAIARMRRQAGLLPLQQREMAEVHTEPCTLAHADTLHPSISLQLGPVRYILRFTSMQPETLPAAALKAVGDHNLHAFAVGACFARTASYPSGTYWVVLALY